MRGLIRAAASTVIVGALSAGVQRVAMPTTPAESSWTMSGAAAPTRGDSGESAVFREMVSFPPMELDLHLGEHLLGLDEVVLTSADMKRARCAPLDAPGPSTATASATTGSPPAARR